MDDHYDEATENDDNVRITRGTLRRLLAQTNPHRGKLIGFFLMITIVALVDSYFTFLNKRIVDEGILGGDQEALVRILIQYGLLQIVSAAVVFGFIWLAGSLSEHIQYDLRRSMYNHLQRLSFSYFDRTHVGWLISRVTSDTSRIGELLSWGILDTSWFVMSTLTAMAFMLFINWKLALVVLALVPILVVVAAQFKKKILVEYRAVRRINSQITGAYNENISGVRVAKALVREEQNLEEFGQLTSEMYRSGFRAAWLSALFLPIVQLISAFAIGGIVWYGGWQFQVAGLTVGGIQAFVTYVTFMLFPIQEMARVYAEMQRAIASAERIFSLLDTEPDVADRPGAAQPTSLRADIEFDHVGFRYAQGQPVLRDFSLRIRAGETVALVGPTGGGKSTIVNLACRFYEPTSGVIRIGGQDYTQLSLHGIHSRLGVVLQTPHLFSGAIRDNIRYGRLNATDEEIETAARVAGAHEFIVELQDGYDAAVGEGGALLSVGQKQLISLARAILAKPDLFIMDEATSSVDTVTEALIQRGMDAILADTTSIVIAHRLSTIRRADRILVIENGAIKEIGSHAELLRARGRYYRLYAQQFRRERERTLDPLLTPSAAPDTATVSELEPV